jgi:Rieske Fe-S protein
MSGLEEWTAAVRAGLGLDPGPLDSEATRIVLDLAREVAHAVDRPAAPVTAFLAGVAVGRGLPLPETSERVLALAARWAEQDGAPGTSKPLGRTIGGSRPLIANWSPCLAAARFVLPDSYGARRPRARPRRGPVQSGSAAVHADERRKALVTAEAPDGRPRPGRRPTRRGLLLGAGLAGLGGALAGCSTAAVPYGADEEGALPQTGPVPSSIAVPANPPSSPGARGRGKARGSGRRPEVTGIVLGSAREIPVGGGKIFDAERVVVTRPARGEYLGFSAVCTHVGCLLNVVADGTIDCPCHGSRFTITNGAVVTGPAPRPLPRKRIAIVGGTVVLL